MSESLLCSMKYQVISIIAPQKSIREINLEIGNSKLQPHLPGSISYIFQ